MSEASDFRIFGTSMPGDTVKSVLHDPAVAPLGEKVRSGWHGWLVQPCPSQAPLLVKPAVAPPFPNIRFRPLIRLLCGLFRFYRTYKVECLPRGCSFAGSSRY